VTATGAADVDNGRVPPLSLPPQGLLVGRADDLAALAGAVGLPTGTPTSTAVLLSGDAGVGKTRLLGELITGAELAGWQVLRGSCLDLGESALPYLPFTEMFGRLAGDDPSRAEQLVADSPGLERLMPLRRRLGAAGDAERMERAQLFATVEETLRRLATRAPLLIVVEDIHWADRSTREMLGFLFARRIPDATVVASYRSDDLHRRHPLRATVAEWARLAGVARMTLSRLTDDDIRTLVRRLAGGPIADRDVRGIVERAEGNAFFTEELVAARNAGGRALSADLADLLLVRVDQLDEGARHVVRASSVAGRRVSHDLLAHVLDLDPAVLDQSVRGAVDGNVLVASTAGWYSFRHALLAEAVYGDLLPGERVRLHAAYARAIASHDVEGTSAELARHARLAGDLRTAIAAAIQAADEALTVGGPDEAAQHYELALELAGSVQSDGGAATVDVVALTLKAAEATAAAGRVHRTLALLQNQLASLPESAPAQDRAGLLVALASTCFLLDTNLDVLQITTEAARLVPAEPPTPLRAQLAGVRARAFAMFHQPDEAALWAVEARELGERLGLPGVVAEADVTLADLDQRAGDPQTSQHTLERSAADARAAGELVAELRSLFKLGNLHWGLGRLDDSAAAFAAATDRARQSGRPWAPYGFDSRLMLALIAYVTGAWDETERLTDLDTEVAPAAAEAAVAAVGLAVVAGRGDTAKLPLLDVLRPWWERDGLIAVLCGGAAIDLHGDNGDLASAIQAHRDVIDTVGRLWESSIFQAQIRLNALLLGQIANETARVGRDQRAALASLGPALVASAIEVADAGARRGAGYRGPESEAWLARLHAEDARLQWLAGSVTTPSNLIESWRASSDAFASFGHVFETARSQIRLAAVLAAAGHTTDATATAAASRAVADRLGAQPLLRELRSLGHAPQPRSSRRAPADQNVQSLTTREREVLALVAQGRSNKEIGQNLFISTKTASVHVSNILAKLGASGRTEAVTLARRRGDLPD
jgi:DNA-binding CsgD family transcriptional regulator/tetratricopeptide (TPR) repeat protein